MMVVKGRKKDRKIQTMPKIQNSINIKNEENQEITLRKPRSNSKKNESGKNKDNYGNRL